MAPKRVVKRTIMKKPMGKAPSAIKGLAGFRKASKIFSGSVDKGVAQQNPALASRASVVAELDARLVYVDITTNSDRYYVLQALEDPKVAAGKPQRYYAYQRWGRTGTGGVCRLQGPMPYAKAESQLKKVFKSKTGHEWDTANPSKNVVPFNYWVVNQSEAHESARWSFASPECFGSGKWRTAWMPYDADTAKQVEELYAEHTANKASPRSLASRLVSTGSFSYRINLDKMTQENTVTGKKRQIRRENTAITRLPSTASQMSAGSSAVLPEESIPSNDSTVGLKRSMSKTSLDDMALLVRTGHIKSMHIPDLKAWLRKHGISVTGSKDDLIDRVRALVW